MAASGDWKQQHSNPYRADGAWVGVTRHANQKYFFGKITTNKKQLNLPTRPTPELAAQDVDRVIYKAHGADALTNGTLTPEVKAHLDGMTLEEVIAQIKATGGNAFSRGSSVYRGVSWDKCKQKWKASFKPGGGRPRLMRSFDSELEAARQYDAWCRQYGRPLTEFNFPPPPAEEDEDGAAAAAAAPAAGPAPAAVAALLAVPAAAAPAASAPPPAASGDLTVTTTPAAAAPASAAAGTSAPAPPPAVPAHPATNMFSPYEEWLEGEDEGGWWTDNSDWEGEEEDQQGAEVVAPAAAAEPAAAQGGSSGGGAAAAAPADAAAAALAGSTPVAGTSASGAPTPGAAADAAAAAQPAHPHPMLIAWRQLHGEAPVPPEVQALMRASSGRSTPADAAADHPYNQHQQQQQEAEEVPAAAAADTCARMLAAYKQSTTMSSDALPAAAVSAHQPNMLVFGSSSSNQTQQQQEATGQAAAGTAAATSAAAAAAAAAALAAGGGGSSAGGAVVQAPATVLDVECESLEQFRADHSLGIAALARAAAAITQHPSCVSTAESAVAAAGAEPPAAAVAELETALRTAASQAVPELQPGGTHYWRGSRAWKYSQQYPTASSTSSGTSTAAAAATTAVQAATPAAAISAALAAAEAEGRGCSAADLQAAWLMQRLSAGLLRVNVRPPAVDMAVLEQALADHGVDVIPGIDYEPVPSLQPELFYPDTAANNPSTDPIPPAAAAATAVDAPSKSDSTAGGPAGRDQAAAGCSKDAAVTMDIDPASDTTAAPDTNPPAAPAAAAGQPAAAAAAGAPSQTIDWAALAEAAEAEAAASATYPYPVPGERRPFDDSSSEEEEPFEAQWLAGLLQGKSMFGAAAAEAAGPTPPYGPSPAATAAAAEASEAAATAAALGGCGLGGSVDGGVVWGAAADRRRHKARMDFDRSHIPTIKIDWTGNEMEDTIKFLEAVVAEGEADHLPSHIKGYRIAELARQKDPNFPLEELLAMGRPIEGEYCPVVLGVPPPHPDAPAAAAAAAAEGVRRPAVKSRIENAFDPVNRKSQWWLQHTAVQSQ